MFVEHLMSEWQHRVEYIIELASARRSIVLHLLATPPRKRVAAGVARGVLQLVLNLHQAVVLRIALAA